MEAMALTIRRNLTTAPVLQFLLLSMIILWWTATGLQTLISFNPLAMTFSSLVVLTFPWALRWGSLMRNWKLSMMISIMVFSALRRPIIRSLKVAERRQSQYFAPMVMLVW